jgi:DNA-binding MarR family transcriptional regulator
VPPATTAPALAADIAPGLGRSIARLARRLRQQDDGGLSPTLSAALWTIAREGPLSLGELAARERVAPPSVTKIVGKLEARGLVERRADEADRRVWRVTATTAGRDHLESSRRRRNAWFTDQLAGLDAPALERLAAAVDVLEGLTTAPDEPAAT